MLPGHVSSLGSSRLRDRPDDPCLPARARVVIVGGGIIGCSIAWHLARRGCEDVLLLERRRLGCGTTWHSQGLVGLVRENETMTRLALHTNEVLPELERLTGLETGFRQEGALIVTADVDRVAGLDALAREKSGHGAQIRRIGLSEAARRWPPLRVDDLAGAWFMPAEGQVNPLDALQAYARAVRLAGASIRENVAVEEVVVDGGRAVGVRAGGREIVADDAVVDASGIWSRGFSARAGVALPMLPVQQSYLVTEALPGLDARLPILRDFHEGLLVREDAGQLTVAALSARERLYGVSGIPADFCFDELPVQEAAWILDGAPTLDLGSVDVRRATADDAELARLIERVPRAAGGFYESAAATV